MTSMLKDEPMIPYSVLEAIPTNGISYSILINDQSLHQRFPDVNDLASEIQKVVALDMIKALKEFTEEEGEDFRLFLTERGKNILKNFHE